MDPHLARVALHRARARHDLFTTPGDLLDAAPVERGAVVPPAREPQHLWTKSAEEERHTGRAFAERAGSFTHAADDRARRSAAADTERELAAAALECLARDGSHGVDAPAR